MKSIFSKLRRTAAVSIAVALALIAVVPATQAESPASLDKHARKIEKRLAKYRPGTFLQFDFRDAPSVYGSLGPLANASFQYTDSDNNKTETRPYADLERVRPAKEYIGEGSAHRRVHLFLPIVIGAGVAAGGIAAYEVMR